MSLTVFLCSTYADLADERQKVLDAVRRLQLEHDSMEFFGARSDLPIETCLAEVQRSHILVVVVGHRYGSLVPNLGISYSEAEYREGRRLQKPCLVYMRDENAPILLKNVERDPEKLKRLEAWKADLTTQHTVATFSEPGVLAVQVAADLARTIQSLREAEDARRKQGKQEDPSGQEWADLLSSALDAGLDYSTLLSTVRRTLSDLRKASGPRRPVVFLSHASADKSIVRKVANQLAALGIDPWLDENELRHGDSLVSAIEKGLDSSDFVVFFISQASMRSAWVRHELSAAISRQISGDRGAIVLPVLLDDSEMPPLLRDRMYLDMRQGSLTDNVKRLATSIERHQLQRLQTYAASADRYFNPPSEVPRLGRMLRAGTFAALVAQLRGREVLVGLYTNQVGALVATYLHTEDRFSEMEGLWAPANGYYAMSPPVGSPAPSKGGAQPRKRRAA